MQRGLSGADVYYDCLWEQIYRRALVVLRELFLVKSEVGLGKQIFEPRNCSWSKLCGRSLITEWTISQR
jgi:hypothetical protein